MRNYSPPPPCQHPFHPKITLPQHQQVPSPPPSLALGSITDQYKRASPYSHPLHLPCHHYRPPHHVTHIRSHPIPKSFAPTWIIIPSTSPLLPYLAYFLPTSCPMSPILAPDTPTTLTPPPPPPRYCGPQPIPNVLWPHYTVPHHHP